MSIVLLVPVLLPLAALLAVVAVLLRRQAAPAPFEAAAAALRHGRVVNGAAWSLAGLVAVVLPLGIAPLTLASVGAVDPLLEGVATGLAPVLVGTVFVGVHAVGERTWPRPTGPVRRAALAHRRARDVVPSWLLRVTVGWGAGLALTLLAGGLTAAGDGRSVERTVGPFGYGASPYPGWFYGVPLACGAALVLGLTLLTLRLVARRPAVVDADSAYDAASRRLSGHRVLRGTQLVLALTLAGVLLFAGSALRGVELVPLGATVALAGALVALVGAALAMVPAAPPVPAPAPTPSLVP